MLTIAVYYSQLWLGCGWPSWLRPFRPFVVLLVRQQTKLIGRRELEYLLSWVESDKNNFLFIFVTSDGSNYALQLFHISL